MGSNKSVYLLGAGASRGYYLSKTGVRPPLANDFFPTFYSLDISADFEVKIGFIVNYLRDTRGISPELIPTDFNENIEDVFAEVDRELRRSFEDVGNLTPDHVRKRFLLAKTYDQFIFWFSHVLNEIQNGPPCPIYSRLIEIADHEDLFVTLNWDTILDKALAHSGLWNPDDGYKIKFEGILETNWREPTPKKSSFMLLKLHGSTNWFGSYVTYDLRDGRRLWLANEENVYCNWCLVDGTDWFDSYKDRWRPGYQSYSYFFPPNDPIEQKPLMPILIPPTEEKRFGEYRQVFEPIWQEAQTGLSDANRLVVCGYSFPRTDAHIFSLLEAFLEIDPRNKIVEIVNPFPEYIVERVSKIIGDRCKILVHEKTLAQYLSLSEARPSDSEIQPISIKWSEQEEKQSDEELRLQFIISVLIHCSIFDIPFDVTTFDGQCYLNVDIVGEFATHLYGAYDPEVYEYRINNIPILTNYGKELKLRLHNIWIIHPLPNGEPSAEDIETVDLSIADDNVKQMIAEGYHCKDKLEEEYFLRRFIAS